MVHFYTAYVVPGAGCTKCHLNICFRKVNVTFLIAADKERYLMKVAMREWEKYSCVRFREKKRTDRNFVRFQNGMG